MLVDFDMSHTGKGQHIGYWATNRVNDPSCLPWPGDFIDLEWDLLERNFVSKYLKGQPDVQHWKGLSFCRLGCGSNDMGSTDKSDGIYTWPAGFAHYIEIHSVRPPQEFINHVTGRCRQHRVVRPKNRLSHIFPLPDWVCVGAKVRATQSCDFIAPNTVATIVDFIDVYVDIALDDGTEYHCLRIDFTYCFEPIV